MGWSCRADAMDALRAIERKMEAAGSKLSNGIVNAKGEDVGFFETSHTEHADGAITGTVFKWAGPDLGNGSRMATKAGSFRIDGDGTVKRFPLVKGATKKK